MEEVTIKLRFTRPALGYAQRRTRAGGVIYVMPRDPAKRIIFLASWWRERMDYAARVLSRYRDLALKIAWDQVVEGRLSHCNRTVHKKRGGSVVKSGFAVHESFRAGAEVTVHAILPDNLTIAAFRELLDIVGRYKGMSPYYSESDTYGTFEVLSIQPTVREPADQEPPCNSLSAAAAT